MSFLVRKIDKGKWLKNDIKNGAPVAADAITICMKTTENTLSTWEIDTPGDIEKAVLAIVAAGDHLETIDVVILDRQYLDAQGVKAVPVEGKTPIATLRKTHHNLENLTYPKLGILAEHTVEMFRKDLVPRYLERELIRILKEAISQSLLSPGDLQAPISRKLS